jgi:glycine amidinotransferase
MYNVYQHWDPLKVCIVGRSYPPEFYSWIKNPSVRILFEKIAIETEEDYQHIIKKLESFGVKTLRPDLPTETWLNGSYVIPPMTPRDYTIMIGDTMYQNYGTQHSFGHFYWNARQPHWPEWVSEEEFYRLPDSILSTALPAWEEYRYKMNAGNCYNKIWQHIIDQGNTLKSCEFKMVNGSMTTRIGKDLYTGTSVNGESPAEAQRIMNQEFPNYRTHIIDTLGHSDGVYCPVCPGLIISLQDVPTYADSFPGWEVVYLPGQSWSMVDDFLKLKKKNKGRWWIPGFEHDQDVIDVIETWLGHWTGYVEETVFDVNMLIIDPKNVMVFNYNKQVFDALDRYGITPHIVPFRHRYFWDGGIHCVTSDLHREGTMQDYFPERG